MTAFWNVDNVHSSDLLLFLTFVLLYFYVLLYDCSDPALVLYYDVLWHTTSYFAVLNLAYNLVYIWYSLV